MSKSVFDQQGCRVLTFALARLSCYLNAFWYERALLSYQSVFLHSDISDFMVHLSTS